MEEGTKISSRPSSGFSRIQFVVFVILGTLQGQLKCEAILGNLVDPYSRGNFCRSRVSSALLARFELLMFVLHREQRQRIFSIERELANGLLPCTAQGNVHAPVLR